MNNFEKFGISEPTCKQRSDSRYKGELEKIDTEEKAYFLGLLYSDGTISNLKKGNTSKSYYVRISLSIVDENLINRLHETFPFFSKRKHDFSKYREGNSEQIELRYYGKYIYKDLKLNGMIENKSYQNKESLNIPNIKEELLYHFIRGFFDGDGSIYTVKSRPNGRRIEICSVSHNFISQLYNWFTENNCKPKIFRTKYSNIQPLHVIEWFDFESVLKLKNLLYKNATIFIDRKKDKFDSFFIPKLKSDKGIICPYCTYNMVQSGGIRKMKKGNMHRYICNKCKKRFSLPEDQLKSDELLENQEIDNQQPS